jgi:hypothetical protein
LARRNDDPHLFEVVERGSDQRRQVGRRAEARCGEFGDDVSRRSGPSHSKNSRACTSRRKCT